MKHAKLVEFYLGPAGSNLDSRTLQIRKRGVTAFEYNTALAGSATTVEVELDSDAEYEAILTDRRDGVDMIPTVMHFTLSTNVQMQSGPLSIISTEETSQSSSSSVSSSSSSSASSNSSSNSSSST